MLALKKKNYFILLILFSIACSIEKATIPSYIYIKKFKTITDPLTQGDTTQDIQDAWLWLDQNNEPLGSYGLPTYIPIIAKGKQKIILRGGIKRSGQDNQRLDYPFYADFDTIINFDKLTSDTISPTVKYLTNCKFPLIQDFDGATSFFSIYNPRNGDSVMKVSNNEAWKLNNNSGKFVIGDTAGYLVYQSKELSNLPGNGIPIYLEVDFKCNNAFFVGLRMFYTNGENYAYDVMAINSTNGDWKKLYIDLSNEISSEIGKRGAGTTFQVFIRLEKSGSPLTDNTHLYLDNIKLIHF